MVTACSSFVRCSWRRWWNKIVPCQPLPSWNIPGTPWSAAPLHQQLVVPVCGAPRSSRHGIPQWVTPLWSLISVDWDNSAGMDSVATILRTSSQKICNPLTWVGILHPWCKGWQGPSPKPWVTLVMNLQSLLRTGRINTPVPETSCHSDSEWSIWTMGWIVQPLCHSHIVSHLWMSMWWSNLVLEPDRSEMEVVNLLRVDWFHHYGRVQGSHPWDRRSLASRPNSIKLSKCLFPVVKRIITSILRWTTQENSAMPWCHTGRWSCRQATLFPHFDFQAGEDFWWPRLEVPTYTPGWGTDWSGWAYSDIPRGLAHEGRTQRNPRWMGRTPFTHRSPQLWLSGSLFRLHQGDIHWRKRDGLGWRSIHQTGGGEQMWVSHSWTLSWAMAFAPSMMVALVGQTLISSRIAQRRQRECVALAQERLYLLAFEGRRLQVPQKNQDSQIRLEVPSGTDWPTMVGQQSGYLWRSQCSVVFGQDGCPTASNPVFLVPWSWLGICLCGWLLLDPSSIQLSVADTGIAGGSPGLGDPSQLEEDSALGNQHMVATHQAHSSKWQRTNMWQSWPYSKSWRKGKSFPSRQLRKPWAKSNGPRRHAQWRSLSCSLSGHVQWKQPGAGEIGPVPSSSAFPTFLPQMSPFSPWSSWTGASDASAEKAGDSWIGGWLTD